MNQQNFDEKFAKISEDQQKFLLPFLQGKTDEEIAEDNFWTQDNCRQHLKNINRIFGLKNPPGNNKSLRPQLIDLFCQFKPELVAPHLLKTRNKQEITQIKPNPFFCRGKIDDPNLFYDRTNLLRQIFDFLNKSQSVSLVGESQIGKSSIMAMICQKAKDFAQLSIPKENFIYIDMQRIHQEEQFWQKLYIELQLKEFYQQNGHNTVELEDLLKNKKYIICIDEIDKMTNLDNFSQHQRQELRSFADGNSEYHPFTFVTASFLSLENLFPDSGLTSPFHNIFHTKIVENFTEDDAKYFLKDRLQGTGISFSDSEIDQLLETTECHPAKLQQEAYNLYEQLIKNY